MPNAGSQIPDVGAASTSCSARSGRWYLASGFWLLSSPPVVSSAERKRGCHRMYDYHTHTTNSPDSRVKMREYCERAIAIGVREVAFTDHIDYDPAERTRGHNKYTAYMADIAACRA